MSKNKNSSLVILILPVEAKKMQNFHHLIVLHKLSQLRRIIDKDQLKINLGEDSIIVIVFKWARPIELLITQLNCLEGMSQSL